MEERYETCRSLISYILTSALGLPVVLTPMQDGKIPVDDPTKGTNPQLNNNFDYGPRGVNPRSQFLCPFAGHTRKTGPRTDVTQAIVEQHAILRSGTLVPFLRSVSY